MVKHKMIPAYSREGIRATLEPAHTFDKVLVSSVSKSTAEESIINISNWCRRLSRCYTIKAKDSHFLQFRVQNSKGTVITNGGQEAGTEAERKELQGCRRVK